MKFERCAFCLSFSYSEKLTKSPFLQIAVAPIKIINLSILCLEYSPNKRKKNTNFNK